MFKPLALYWVDWYKLAHKKMLAKGIEFLYGTWIPRSLKYAPKGTNKIVSFGQQLTAIWLRDEFEENFFKRSIEDAQQFAKDMALGLGQSYNADHFYELHKLGYLPIRIKSLPEGIETNMNIPHMTFINTVKDYAWLTLFLETIISALAWKAATSATIAKLYRRNAQKWVNKTDKENLWLVDYMCHDFSARGLDPFAMYASGLGHATSFRGSDSIIVIPAARYYYGEPNDTVCINSVNASEHSVSTTKIFTVGEQQMIADWLVDFPEGILSIVADTFDLWKLITEYLPANKEAIIARKGKLVIRPDSGNPADIICGTRTDSTEDTGEVFKNDEKGVIELLWEIFGGTVSEQGYKVLDSHIGAIYGDSITTDRQIEIYERLAKKGFAATNICLGVGSYTYQMNSRDTLGFAAKGAWFETETEAYDIYKDPITDEGTKRNSLRGLQRVDYNKSGEIVCYGQQTKEQESQGLLQTIFENGKCMNLTTLTQIREKLSNI